MIDRALITVYGAGLAALLWLSSSNLEPRIIQAVDKAPWFSIATEDGRKVTRDNFPGKLLVLNFWATWCRPCLVEMPSLDAFAQTLGPKGVAVLAVSIDEQDEPYRRALQRLRPQFLLSRDRGGELASEFGTFMVPETYVLDSKGRVLRKYVAATDWMDPALLAEFEAMLLGK